MFAGLTVPTEGRILHDGRAIEGVNTRVGYVTQDDNLLPWRTTLANVEIALELKGVPRASRRARASEYLGRVGLRGFEHHYPHELSGGMRKRASIVRTLVDESVNVILMDEPLGPLDAQTRLLLQDELLQLWQGSGRTVVFVTHDLVEAIALSDRIAIFTSAPGRIKEIREVRIPRPRDVFHIHESPGFSDIYDAIWNDLRDEIRRRSRGRPCLSSIASRRSSRGRPTARAGRRGRIGCASSPGRCCSSRSCWAAGRGPPGASSTASS